jgi:putative transcriptional regulator
MHRMRGTGLPDVRLVNGFDIQGEGDDQSVAYEDLQGLFKVLARTVACRGANLTAPEFRFLRKRLSMSQSEVGRYVGATDQAVAKWEKGTTPVPVAAARLLRLAWLNKHSRRDLNKAVEKMLCDRDFVSHGYVFEYVNGEWRDVSSANALEPIKAQAAEATWTVIQSFMTSNSDQRLRPEETKTTFGPAAIT